MTSAPCCAKGCQRVAAHKRVYEITGEWMGMTAASVDAWFCWPRKTALRSST